MNMDQVVDETVGESLPTLDASRGNTSNPAGDLVTLIAQTRSDSAGVEGLEARAGELLPTIASCGLQGEVHAAPPPSGSHTIGDLALSQKSLAGPSSAVEETVHAIESSAGNPIAFVGDVAAIGSTGDIKDKAQALVLTRLRAIVFSYTARLPIVGSYFADRKRAGEPNGDTLATETTPLLGDLQDPKAFATQQAEGLLRRLLSPLLNRLPDVDTLDNAESDSHGPLFKVFVECYVLTREGGGLFFSHLQEHSLVIAPTVSLGHLSTTDLAASSIGTAVASMTGYSIIQGFISSLDKALANAPNRRAAGIACAQVAVVTGIALLPITNLWAVQSSTLFQRLGQPPEVAGPASEFLRITAAGLPGYAIGEIAKRYLTSQGLSHVHTRLLSATAPLNLVLNYLLVDGPIPALRLGFAGAPLCTVLSHNALAIMLVIYIVQRVIREEVEYLRGQNIVPDEPARATSNPSRPTGDNHSQVTYFTGLGALFFSGISGVAKSASQLWSKDFGGVVASILGPNALATQAVLHTTATTLYQAPKAVGNASSERITKWIARGDVQRAKIAALVAFVGTLTSVIVISNVLIASATSWGALFNNDPVIIQNVAMLVPVMAVFQAVQGIGAWVDSALGSLGKTAVFPSLNASADYFLGIPLGVHLALQRQWGLAGLWIGLTISLAYSCLVAMIVLVRTNWKNAKKENTPRRADEEAQPANEPRGFGTIA
ncbi:hypothetical protein L210DRAFT_83388 [Boletus edulis BED1]|uniref:MATE efflux family protein n=1 Tax=Boletus edulis BED1 TaxID=1328754 RepID=A0AAD4BL30_BOLED|nr:hypothetical protein L210DRAFT_83388 [Boletus edulis BED1]